MSRIFPSGSDVYFESLRFRDLESGPGDDGSVFVRKPPAGKKVKKDAPAAGKQEARKESQPPQQEPQPAPQEPAVDIEAERQEAYQKGRQEGRKEAEEKLHSAAQALAEALEQISRMRESLLRKSREDMVRLVMAAARQVIQAEVEEREDIISRTVTRALESAVESDEYYIRVNPGDLDRVKEDEPLFLAAMKGLENIRFIADESISKGGCRAESQAGDVDATIETQMEKVFAHLRSEVLGRPEGGE